MCRRMVRALSLAAFLLAGFGAQAPLPASADDGLLYECFSDTASPAEVYLGLSGDRAVIEHVAPHEWVDEGRLDPTYRPRTRAGRRFARYTGLGDIEFDWSDTLLVERSLTRGRASGALIVIHRQDPAKGRGRYDQEYRCTRARR